VLCTGASSTSGGRKYTRRPTERTNWSDYLCGLSELVFDSATELVKFLSTEPWRREDADLQGLERKNSRLEVEVISEGPQQTPKNVRYRVSPTKLLATQMRKTISTMTKKDDEKEAIN
jgi:hypothetical protein